MENDTQYHILIVDDEPKNVKLAASILGVVKNYKIAYSTSGEKALEMIRKEKYDLILLDVNMPDMDGFEVAEILKRHPKTQNISIIFLTAMQDNRSIERGFKIGAADYITKPINKIELVSRIKTIFVLQSYKKQLKAYKSQINFLNRINQITIDAQEAPIVFHNDNKILTCNKYLLHLLGYEDIENFLSEISSLKDLFYDSNCSALQLEDIEWLEEINKSDEVNRVSIKTIEGLVHFSVHVEKSMEYQKLRYIIFFVPIEKPIFIPKAEEVK